jgi:hypothetical protein
MDYSAPFRDLVGTKVVLVQGQLREDVVVEEIVLQLGDPDEEELRLRVATAEGTEQVVYLIPRDATRATLRLSAKPLSPRDAYYRRLERGAGAADSTPQTAVGA